MSLEEPGHRSGPRGAWSFFPTRLCLGAPQRLQQQLRAPRTVYAHVSVFAVCGSLAECLLVFSRALLQLLLFFFFGFSPVSSHRGGKKKKRSRMFGKICRSVEHFLHWCKRRGGQRGRGGSRSLELRVRAPGRGPQAL